MELSRTSSNAHRITEKAITHLRIADGSDTAGAKGRESSSSGASLNAIVKHLRLAGSASLRLWQAHRVAHERLICRYFVKEIQGVVKEAVSILALTAETERPRDCCGADFGDAG